MDAAERCRRALVEVLPPSARFVRFDVEDFDDGPALVVADVHDLGGRWLGRLCELVGAADWERVDLLVRGDLTDDWGTSAVGVDLADGTTLVPGLTR